MIFPKPQIHNCNNKHIFIKNKIAKILACVTREIKKDHLNK